MLGRPYRKPQPIKMYMWSPVSMGYTKYFHTYNTGKIVTEEVKRLKETEDQGVCYETVSHRNVRSYTHEVSPTRLHDRSEWVTPITSK